MKSEFQLSALQKRSIAKSFYTELCRGLKGETSTLLCAPTYLVPQALSKDKNIVVLDLGGSNLRAALVNVGPTSVRVVGIPVTIEMPWLRNESFSKEQFLSLQAKLILQVITPDVTHLAYCFSYPCDSQANGDAILTKWTKGIYIPDTQGENIGAMLLAYLNQQGITQLTHVKVLNDAVATLLAGISAHRQVDSYIGLVAGTGSNMASFFRATDLNASAGFASTLPVNLETGNFHPDHLTAWDDQLNQQSDCPDVQHFEKASSGMYLGQLFALRHPKIEFDPQTGAKGLRTIIKGKAPIRVKKTALCIYERSASLVACKLSGLIEFLTKHYGHRRILITAEGGLFWSKLESEYKTIVEQELEHLLKSQRMIDIEVKIVKIEHANFIGAAIGTA